MERKECVRYFIFLILSLTLFLMIINTLQMETYFSFFWYCYLAIFLLIIGVYKKNSSLILSQIIIIAIPDLLWIFDFFYLIVTGHTLLGLANNFAGNLLERITSVQHVYVVPLSILALSIIKIKKDYKTLLISAVEIILIFLLTLFLVPTLNSVNCVHQNCLSFPLTFLPYPLEWFILVFGFMIISYWLISSLPILNKNY